MDSQELAAALLRRDVPSKDLVAALKKQPYNQINGGAALRAFLFAEASPETTVEVTLRARPSSRIAPHKAECLLADAPGAEVLRAAFGDMEQARFDSLASAEARGTPCFDARAGKDGLFSLILSVDRVPTGCIAGSTWSSVLPVG